MSLGTKISFQWLQRAQVAKIITIKISWLPPISEGTLEKDKGSFCETYKDSIKTQNPKLNKSADKVFRGFV